MKSINKKLVERSPQLLDCDSFLALYGDGNTSVKLQEVDFVGDEEDFSMLKVDDLQPQLIDYAKSK